VHIARLCSTSSAARDWLRCPQRFDRRTLRPLRAADRFQHRVGHHRLKAYGAGLLSSYGEIQEYERAEIRPWDLDAMDCLITGLTFPGMMLLPGCVAGMLISPIPHRGPEASRRMSLAIFESEMAMVFNCPEASTTPSLAACASK
jgi:hypothetical protein